MNTLQESVDNFHETIRIIEIAISLPIPYDFLADPDNVVARYENVYRILKATTQNTRQGGDMRADRMEMIAQCANLYRDFARQITEFRDPKIAARRKQIAQKMRRQSLIDHFLLAEITPYWKADSIARGEVFTD